MHRSAIGLRATLITCLALIASPPIDAQPLDLSSEVNLNIPAQALETELLELSHQASLQLVISADTVPASTGPAIVGKMPIKEALDRLLRDTNLTYKWVGAHTVTVTQRSNARTTPTNDQGSQNAADSSPDRLRLAQTNPAAAGEPVAAAPGNARTSEADSDQLEEIIVTARRREESAQHVPVAITALTGKDLESKRIETAQDLEQYVPSMAAFAASGVRDGTSFSLRGQSSITGAPQAVVVYLDEVPLPGNAASSANGGGPGLYLDLDNLEVLNGPQGTLFGRNTTGGAVLIQPKKPTDKLEGYAQVGFGDYNDQEYEGVFNVPLVDDKLLLRVAGQRQTRNGFTRNIVNGQELDNRDSWAARATLSFRPSDSFQDDLLFYRTRSQSNGTGRLITTLNPAGFSALLYTGIFGTPNIQQAFADQQARGVRATAQDAPSNESSEYWGFIDVARWSITDSLTLKNIAGYQVVKSAIYSDVDGTAVPVFSSLGTADTENMSEELQLQGKSFSNNLTWTTGAFIEYDEPRGPQVLNGAAFGGLAIFGPLNPGSISFTTNGSTQRSPALYAQGTYDLGGLAPALEGLNFTAGYRYTWDHRRDFNRSVNADGSCVTAGQLNCTFTASENFSAGTWTTGLDYQINADTLTYVKASRGYKGGGFNLGSIDPAHTTFKPEYVQDVEIGLKKDWNFGAFHARTNIDAFHTDYTDIQKGILIFYQNIPSSIIDNAAAARINGVEFSGAIVPVPSLDLSWSYSYLDAKYTKAIAGSGFDTHLPFYFTPQNKFSVTGTYQLPLTRDLGELKLSATYTQTSKLFSATDFEPGGYISGYGLLNVRADWDDLAGKPLDLSFFITNATDTVYRVNDFPAYNFLGLASSTFGEPRMYGVQLRYRFGPDEPWH